ncbi:MAG: RNA pseudouridine synthase [Marinilabiliales bacterium]|nr:MAG: RNA pseudouridine synthase [Marinilabiliales bacterium]
MQDPENNNLLSEEHEENQELFEHHRIIVDKGQAPLRIDKFLFARIENASRNKIQMAAKEGLILVNEKAVKSNYKIKPSDIISVVMTHPPREIEVIAEKIPLNIVYEDKDILVVNKEPGMVVHPAYGNYTGTLVNALVYYLKDDQYSEPCLVHRIDKDTSGIMLVAKNEIAQTRLAKQFFDHSIQRRYIALVWGDFEEEEGTVTGHLGRSKKDRKVMTVYPEGDYGKHAVTHYKVLERFGYITMIECRLETGRTHQIRAHMQYIRHPLFNDQTYGGDAILKGTTFTKYKQFINNCFEILPRQALHAKILGFTHPITGKEMYFDSGIPDDMQQVIDKWRVYINAKNTFED